MGVRWSTAEQWIVKVRPLGHVHERLRVPADLAGEAISGSWKADSLSLVADRSSPFGTRFEDLARFRLAGGG